jgi:hypothetical protein
MKGKTISLIAYLCNNRFTCTYKFISATFQVFTAADTRRRGGSAQIACGSVGSTAATSAVTGFRRLFPAPIFLSSFFIDYLPSFLPFIFLLFSFHKSCYYFSPFSFLLHPSLLVNVLPTDEFKDHALYKTW